MLDLAPRIKEIWSTRRDEVIQSANKIGSRSSSGSGRISRPSSRKDVLAQAYEELSQRFDPSQGGFSQAPKFPTPHNMLFLLRYWKRTGDARALEMVEKHWNPCAWEEYTIT